MIDIKFDPATNDLTVIIPDGDEDHEISWILTEKERIKLARRLLTAALDLGCEAWSEDEANGFALLEEALMEREEE